MTSKEILNFVDARTKIITVFSFLMGTFFSIHRFGSINILNFFLLFILLLFTDITISSLKNYIHNIRRSNKEKGARFEDFVNISEETAMKFIFVSAIVTGLSFVLLSVNTNFIIAFAMVILFINATKFALKNISVKFSVSEIIHAIISIFMVFFLSIYIYIYDENIILLSYLNKIFTISFYVQELAGILLLSMPILLFVITLFISRDLCNYSNRNIEDRFVWSRRIGERRTIIIIALLYLLAYTFILLIVILGYVHVIYLISVLSIFKVYDNFRKFSQAEITKRTIDIIYENIYILNTINMGTLLMIALIQDHVSKL